MSAAISAFYVGSTIFLELAFSDRNGNPVTPTAVSMQILDISNGAIILPTTAQTPPSGSQTTLEIPIAAGLNVMTRPAASQSNVVVIRTVNPDGSNTTTPFPYTLSDPTYLKILATNVIP